MIDLPKFVDLVVAENTAASMSRGLIERTDSWGHLIAQAQQVLVAVQNSLSRLREGFPTESFYDPQYSEPLIAAARVLDAASQATALKNEHRRHLALCSAAAFAMYGNFPAAHAAIANSQHLSTTESSRIWLAIGCFDPRSLGNSRKRAIESKDALSSAAIEKLQSFLLTGNTKESLEADRHILKSFESCADNLENLLLGYARVALRHVEVLSTQRSLSLAKVLSKSVIERIIEAGVPTLLPSQFGVLQQSDFLQRKDNALICLPTSTGKTLIGELTIAAALEGKPGLAIYIAPYVAIGLQAARALRQHLPKPYRVHTLIGGLSSDVQINSGHLPEVIVTTPERLDAILRRFNFLKDLRIVVVDEAHVVSDGVRGVRLEALLSRLRLQQERQFSFRIIALSAVMADSQRFRNWLGVPDDLFITCLWRPTARRVAIWRSNNKLTWLYAGDELRPQHAKSTTIFGTKSLVWPARMFPVDGFAQTKAQAPALFSNAAYLCRQMYEEYSEPVLCVCASRGSSRGVAYRLATDLEPYEVLDPALADAISFIDQQAPHLAGLKKCLSRGVAFHNAALPLKLRQLIETAVEKRILKVVCATTTLAEGVDLPFRVTVLAEWLQWRLDTRDGQQPFGALKFRNIAGRSGRAGVFTEGDTVVFENVLGPSKYADHQNRTASILSMIDRPNEVTSALEEEVLPSELEARRRVISSNFLAAIRENPDDEALEKSFADRLLVRQLSGGESIRSVTSKIRSDVLGGGGVAFAKAASPLRLTPIGEAASQSVFSPESCRQIIQALENIPETNELELVAAYLLERLGGLPEQHNTDWGKIAIGAGSRFVVKLKDLPMVLTYWRNGVALATMFAELPSVKKSKAKESVSEWLAGEQLSENWSGNFDKFVDFIDTVLEQYLPWLLEACAALAIGAEDRAQPPWPEFIAIVDQVLKKRHPSPEAVSQNISPAS